LAWCVVVAVVVELVVVLVVAAAAVVVLDLALELPPHPAIATASAMGSTINPNVRRSFLVMSDDSMSVGVSVSW
jgi:hypothetical protein